MTPPVTSSSALPVNPAAGVANGVRNRLLVVTACVAFFVALSIPLMAAYGLKVCPILLPLGFWFGCEYLLLFALNLCLLNALFLRGIARRFSEAGDPESAGRLLAAPWRGAGAYVAAYTLTVVELLLLLLWRGVPLQSRGPEILGLLVLLLATLQYFGTAWAVLPAAGSAGLVPRPESSGRSWTRGAVRVTVPALIASVVGGHFLFRSAGMAHQSNGTVAAENPFGMIHLLGFLLLWQVAVMAFYAAAELDFGRRAARHLQAVAADDFAYRTGLFGWGYWPELFRTMNQLSQGLLERGRLLRGFSSFVSNRVVDDVLKQEIHFGGARVELTVLMADLRDFTALAERLKPEDVVRLLNLYFYAMIEELSREGVTVDKFIGDGLLAYVEPGSSGSAGRESAMAVRAALNMQRRMKAVNEELAADGLPRLRLGVGIARGELVLGNIGSRERMQYTVIGDTVNLTARLESLSKDLDAAIVIASPVWQGLPPDLQQLFKARGDFAVKGRTEQVAVYAC
jgi:class 3 adenylate cyclase